MDFILKFTLYIIWTNQNSLGKTLMHSYLFLNLKTLSLRNDNFLTVYLWDHKDVYSIYIIVQIRIIIIIKVSYLHAGI